MAEYTGGAKLRKIVRQATSKAPFSRVTVERGGSAAVVSIHTVKPDTMETRRGEDLVTGLERVVDRAVTVQVVPEARAVHKYVRVSPTKARRVMDEVRGRYVDEALAILQFMPNRAARYVAKLLRSAAANADDGWGGEPERLKVVLLTADAGPTQKRIQPRAMGRAYRILKRTAHLTAAVQQAEARPARGRAARRGGRAAVTRA